MLELMTLMVLTLLMIQITFYRQFLLHSFIAVIVVVVIVVVVVCSL